MGWAARARGEHDGERERDGGAERVARTVNNATVLAHGVQANAVRLARGEDRNFVLVLTEPAIVHATSCSPNTAFDSHLSVHHHCPAGGPSDPASTLVANNDPNFRECGSVTATITDVGPPHEYYLVLDGNSKGEAGAFELTAACTWRTVADETTPHLSSVLAATRPTSS